MRFAFVSLGLLMAAHSNAQEAVPSSPPASQGPQWALSAGTSHISTSSSAADERTVSLRRYGEWGSLAVERLHLQRFGQSDAALALDAYPRLWEGAYANVRYQSADHATLYPSTSWRAELYQNISGGWEAAASRDTLNFTSSVHIDGVALAKYWGNFYFRWRHQQVRSDTSSGKGDRFVARYYYEGDADHYVEANISNGRSDDASGNVITSGRSDTKGVAWLHYFNAHWGFKASASQSNDTSLSTGRERSMSASLTYRW